MKLDQRSIFLLDGLGAFTSASLTGFILPELSEWTGIPHWVTYSLAIFPLLYAFYSLSVFKFVSKIKRVWLEAIMIANLFYCFLSAVVIFAVREITMWGQIFLFAEILVILLVVALEFKIYSEAFKSGAPQI